jgi:CRP-like cAMP-binding protein
MRSRTPSTSLGSLEKLLLIFENSFLRSVKPDALLELARRSKIQMYNRGDVVYQMGEISHELHLVVSGAVDVIVNQGGQDIVINTIHCGQTIGEMGVLSRQPRSATVVGSAEHNKLLVIEAEVFDAVLRGDSEISRSLLLDMIERLRRTNVHLHA